MADLINTAQPTVMLVIGGSYIAFDEDGEVVETVEVDESGQPDWSYAGGCDHRGMGGANGYAELVTALNAAEGNARLCDIPITRVAVQG